MTRRVVEVVDEDDDDNQQTVIVVDDYLHNLQNVFHCQHDDDIHFEDLLYLFQQYDQVQELFHE